MVACRRFLKIVGRVAEWLGSGLQNRVRRFESARDLDFKWEGIVREILAMPFGFDCVCGKFLKLLLTQNSCLMES
jgi:hypothetical protein